MYLFNEGSKPLSIYFLKEEHVALLRGNNIPLSEIDNLLYYDVTKDDLLDWISFQRSVERKLFGRGITVYGERSKLKYAATQPKHDMSLLEPALRETYEENKYYDNTTFSSYTVSDDTIIILLKDNDMLENGFNVGRGSILKTIYHVVLRQLGYHQTYFHNPVRGKDSEGITLPELIATLTS